MKAQDFEHLDWLLERWDVDYNFGSSCITALDLKDFPGYDHDAFDLMLDCSSKDLDDDLREEFASWYSVDAKNIAITSSASEGNFLVEALFSPGTFAVETPVYEPLWKVADVLDTKVLFIPRSYENKWGFGDGLELLKEQARDIDLMVLTNLHNPSGTALARDELKEIVEICDDAGATVLVDEIFRSFSDEPSALLLGENVVVNSSPSKFFGGCGLRIGHLAGPESLIRDIGKLKFLLCPEVSIISLRAYGLMIRNVDWFIRRGREIMGPSTEMVANWIDSRDDLEWIPSFSNVAFPRMILPAEDEGQDGGGLVTSCDTMALGRFLADECGVLITPGEYLKLAGFFRIGYGVEKETLENGLDALGKGLDEWWSR